MGEQNLNIRIKHKYDTEANWNKNNPVLLSGEIAITSDKFGKHKVGDGTHKWSELSYAKAELTKGDVISALGYTPPSSDTWRGIQDNLISSSTTESLSAAQGKILKELVDGKAPSSHTHTKSEVGLGNVDNTADSAKSVKYATSAGSAGSVAWANVSGKPAITGKQTRTLTASGPSGWKDATTDQGFVPDMAFMAYWNGAYSGSSSNLAYCNRGAFGTIVTKNAGDYAPASHTHNYAGSSSAGGNANAAVKLANARKIGSASFDGTADITLSQMGVINPIELTRAEYEDLIINKRIDDNQYYNVIDDYDSDILINDSSVSKKYVYSSDKTEKTYSKKSTTSTVTLSASAWSGSSAPYSCVLSVEGVTATNIIEINYASSASDAAIEAYQGAGLKDGGQSAGRITLLATEKPTVNIPITIIVRNDL